MQAGLPHDAPPADPLPGGTPTLRRCIASGVARPRGELLRFVVGPDRQLVPDITGRLPGRGIWLSADRDSVKTAHTRKLFERAARQALRIDAGLADLIESLLAMRCVELIGMARRAGQAAAGFEKVRAELSKGRAGLLLSAADGATDGRRKLRYLAQELPVAQGLLADELGRAFGRERVVHGVVAQGALAQKIANEASRLEGFRREGRERGLE